MKKLLLILIILAIAVFTYFEISNKGSSSRIGSAISDLVSPATKNPFESPLLSYLPNNVYALQVCDYSSPAAKTMWDLPVAQRVRKLISSSELREKMLQQARQFSADPKLLEAIEGVLKSFDKALDSTNFNGEMVIFHTIDGLGVISKNNDITENDLAPLLAAIKSFGVSMDEEKQSNYSLYSIDLGQFANKELQQALQADLEEDAIGSLHLGFGDKLFAITTNKQFIENILQGKTRSEKIEILKTERFEKALKALPYNPKTSFCYNYSDIKRSATEISKAAKEKLSSLEKKAPDGDDVIGKMENFFAEIPVEFLAQTNNGRGLLGNSVALGLSQHSELIDLPKWLGILGSGSSSKSFGLLAPNNVFSIGISGKLLVGVRDMVLESTFFSSGIPEEDKQQLSKLDTIEEIALAVAFPAVAMPPIPDPTFVIKSSNPKELFEFVKTAATDGLKDSAATLQWQTVEIEGVEVQTLPLPIGRVVSVFINDDSLVVTSSELSLRAAIESAKGGTNNLLATYKKQGHLRKDNAFLSISLNLKVLFEGLEQIKGMVIAMSGVDAPEQIIQEVIEIGKSLGVVSSQSWVEDHVIFVEADNG